MMYYYYYYSSRVARQQLLLTFLLSYLCASIISSPLTNPLTSDGEIGRVIPDHFESRKTKAFHALAPNKSFDTTEISLDQIPSCSIDLALQWSENVGRPVLATPVISPGTIHLQNKNIFLSSLQENIELFEGDGSRPPGWPIRFPKASFHASPIVFDIDGDGFTDVGVCDEAANLYWIRVSDYGQYLEDYHIQIPKLRVRRNWMELMQSKDDVSVYVSLSRFPPHSRQSALNSTKSAQLDPLTASLSTLTRRVKRDVTPSDATRRRLEEEVTSSSHEEEEEGELTRLEDLPDEISSEDLHRFEFEEGIGENSAEGEGPEGFYGYAESVNFVRNGATDDAFTYYMMHRYSEEPTSDHSDDKFIAVDPHLLATPAMADINGDGHMEIVFPVSYYFDEDADPLLHQMKSADTTFRPEQYVASGVVCWDMMQQEWLWTVHLDLTTAAAKFPAVIYSSPTIADLDGDDRLEIIVGTSVGMLYVLDGQSGLTRRFFPIQFHSIHAQVAVADVVGGAHLELIVADMAGTLAVLTSEGEILWDKSLSGALPFTPTVADVDQDGQLDVIVATVDESERSQLFVLRGDNGQLLEGFPIALPNGAVTSGPVLVANLDLRSEFEDPIATSPASSPDIDSFIGLDDLTSAGTVYLADLKRKKRQKNETTSATTGSLSTPHLLVTTLDGKIYFLQVKKRGVTSEQALTCVQRIDLGSPIVATPLLDDVTNDGYLDLVVATTSGEVSVYDTSVPFHPANAWNSFPRDHGRSFVFGDISVAVAARDKRHLQRLDLNHGQNLSIDFSIVDRRCAQKPCSRDEYRVQVTRGSDRQSILWEGTFTEPGDYKAVLRLNGPESAVYAFTMETKSGKYAEDFVEVDVSTRFYVWLKYLIVGPLVLFSFLSFLKVSHYL